MKNMQRAWINIPSHLNDLHKYHGKTCIADIGDETSTVYFEKGNLISMNIPTKYLEVKNSQNNIFETEN